jgi:hypothetical protein
MIGHSLQSFSHAEEDYRHAQLMADVSQHLSDRRASHRRLHDLLRKPLRRRSSGWRGGL